MDHQEFSNFLSDRIRERGLNVKRLSEQTGISVKHIEAILSGNTARLPSPPYLKGYLSKLGLVLDFDSDEAWEHMKKNVDVKSSGKADELPKNRFSPKPVNKYFFAGLIAALLIIYVGFRFYQISGTPTVTISNPLENMASETANYISVFGKASNADELKLNGESVEIQPNGDWQKNVLLQPGINTIEITAKKFLGREVKIIRQIVYQPATNTNPYGIQQSQGF